MIDIIKEYLVAVGFEVDKKGFSEAQKSFDKIDKAINKVIKTIGETEAFQKTGKRIVEVFGEVEKKIIKTPVVGKVVEWGTKLTTGIGAIKLAIAGAIAALIVAITAATAVFMSKMAAVDMQIQKLALSLFTTTQNARSLKAVMDSMGVGSIDELRAVALNPELRAQFMSLRRTAAGLEGGADVQQGFRNIRAAGLETNRLGVIMNYFWQNLGGKLGHVLAGPLASFEEFMKNFNQLLIDNMPAIMDTISGLLAFVGVIVDLFFKGLTILTKILSLFTWVGKLIALGVEILYAPIKPAVDAVKWGMDRVSNAIAPTPETPQAGKNPDGKGDRNSFSRLPSVKKFGFTGEFLDRLAKIMSDEKKWFITAAQEGGHAPGKYSHGTGYKFDLGLNGKSKDEIVKVMQALAATPGFVKGFLESKNGMLGNTRFADILSKYRELGGKGNFEVLKNRGATGPHLDVETRPTSVTVHVHGDVKDEKTAAYLGDRIGQFFRDSLNIRSNTSPWG